MDRHDLHPCRLGGVPLINRHVKTGSANPGRKLLTLVAAMLAGATHIDHVDLLRAGATGRVLPFVVAAPSTVGTFLRSFTFGHLRQLPCSPGPWHGHGTLAPVPEQTRW